MSGTVHLAPLDRLPPAALAEVTADADLQTRKDRKYLIGWPVLDELLRRLDPRTRVLLIDGLRCFRYESTYFDTPDLMSYHDAARRRPRRFKVRTRSYLDSGECALEVKTRDARGRTIKHRHPHDIAARHRMTPDGERFVAGIALASPVVHRLAPTLVTAYRRATLVLPDDGGRATVDLELVCRAPGGGSASPRTPVIVETKTPGPPSPVDRALWSAGCRPVSVSKYCTGLAALRPDLPANAWNRVLRRHFGWAPQRL